MATPETRVLIPKVKVQVVSVGLQTRFMFSMVHWGAAAAMETEAGEAGAAVAEVAAMRVRRTLESCIFAV